MYYVKCYDNCNITQLQTEEEYSAPEAESAVPVGAGAAGPSVIPGRHSIVVVNLPFIFVY